MYEEEKNEQPNRFKKDSRGRPETIKLSEREWYLNKEDFEIFVTLRSDYTDGKFTSKDPEYKEVDVLRKKYDSNKRKV